MKLRFRDKAIALLLLTAFAIYAVFNYVVFPANKEVDKLKEKKEKVEALLSDIDPLLKETEEKQMQKDKIYEKYDLIRFSEGSNTATSEEFLVFLGSSAETNNVKVTGFSDLGNSFEDGVYKAYYDVELSGTPYAIKNVVGDLDTMGIVFSVGSASFRQDKEYDYLRRFFDAESNLTWYTEPEEEEVKEEAPTEQTPMEQAPPPQTTPPQAESSQSKPEEKEEPKNKEGVVIPYDDEEDESIENRLDELLKLRASNSGYRVMPLTNTTVISENPYTNEMRLAFTVCLIMFNEPSPETSFINVQKVEESEETEEDDEVF